MRGLFRPRPAEFIAAGILGIQLTAILLLLRPVSVWYLRPVLAGIAILAILFPSILRTPATWAGVMTLLAAWVIREWPFGDNHHYLFVYWTLAIFLALCSQEPDRFLAKSARWLLVGVFLWATLWKAILSPDYMDGRFYRVRLLTDHRFSELVQLVGGVSAEQMESSRAYLEPPPYGRPVSAPPVLVEPRSVVGLARLLTWMTVLIEGAVALAFLLPWGRWTESVRSVMLLFFCLGAYAIAPVASFGAVLLAMGVVQVPVGHRVWRGAYVAAFLLLRFYADVPWGRLLIGLRSVVLA